MFLSINWSHDENRIPQRDLPTTVSSLDPSASLVFCSILLQLIGEAQITLCTLSAQDKANKVSNSPVNLMEHLSHKETYISQELMETNTG